MDQYIESYMRTPAKEVEIEYKEDDVLVNKIEEELNVEGINSFTSGITCDVSNIRTTVKEVEEKKLGPGSCSKIYSCMNEHQLQQALERSKKSYKEELQNKAYEEGLENSRLSLLKRLKTLEKEDDFIKSLCNRESQALRDRFMVRDKMPEIEKQYQEEVQAEAQDLFCCEDFYRCIAQYSGHCLDKELIRSLDWVFVSSLIDDYRDICREFRWKKLEILNESQLMPIRQKIFKKRMKIMDDLKVQEDESKKSRKKIQKKTQEQLYEDKLQNAISLSKQSYNQKSDNFIMKHKLDREINDLYWQVEQGNYEMIDQLETKRGIRASLSA